MTKEEIGAILKSLRISSGMTQKEVAERIGRKQQIVGHWETGYSQPDANTLFLLCDLYGVSIYQAFGFNKKLDVSSSEYEMIKKYRSLDDYGKDMVDTVLDKEYARSSEQTAAGRGLCETPAVYHLPYYNSLASAGDGEYIFDDIPAQILAVPDTPTAHAADFIIGVNGQSMEPKFNDGDKVFVKKTTSLNFGSIGIFVRGNECFIKQYESDRLVSVNKDYPDIPASNDIFLVGEVIGKI